MRPRWRVIEGMTLAASAACASLAFGLAGCAIGSSGVVLPAPSATAAAREAPAAERGTGVAPGSRSPAYQGGRKTYPLRGEVVAVEEKGRRLTVRHEAIPGLMPRMTMPFTVRAPAGDSVAAGDVVTARLSVSERESWLEELRVVRSAPRIPSAPAVTFSPRRRGERVSDFRLTDQDGRPLRLRDLRGRTTAVTFIYTRCPLPNYCPLMSQRFLQLQARLRAQPRLRDRVALLTVSFDPTYDSPARLREYGRRWGADFRLWRLATGDPRQVAELAAELGVLYAPDRGLINHNLETVVLDEQGRLARRFSGSDWAAEALIAEVERSALNPASRSQGVRKGAPS